MGSKVSEAVAHFEARIRRDFGSRSVFPGATARVAWVRAVKTERRRLLMDCTALRALRMECELCQLGVGMERP